jgi:hypothetical protein
MSIPQLSVFVENKPGHLVEALGILAAGNVNVLSFTIADTTDYGILRLVVDRIGEAEKLFEAAGYVVAENPVVGALLPNRPGALVSVLRLVSEHGLDIDYMYLGTRDSVMLKTEELERLEALLVANGFQVLGPEDLARPGQGVATHS